MNWKKTGIAAGVITGVFVGVKYIFPVILPFLLGWILAEAVYPAAACAAQRKFFAKLHITETMIGAVIILVWTVAGISILLLGAEYLTEKIGDCIKYYPVFKSEAGRVIEQCCRGAEHMTGIPAGESRNYIYTKLYSFWQCLWENGRGVDTAVGSVKGCMFAVGLLILVIVSSILFLQEREKIRGLVENREIYKKTKNLYREISRGAKAYLKAQIKIMTIVCVICVAGLWLLRVKCFLGVGLGIGVLDMLPVLGTGTFLIPWGIVKLLMGKTAQGTGLLVLYVFTAGLRQLLEPRLVGNHVGVSPLLVLVSVYLGIVLYGGFGFVLGPLSGLILYGIFKEWNKKW